MSAKIPREEVCEVYVIHVAAVCCLFYCEIQEVNFFLRLSSSSPDTRPNIQIDWDADLFTILHPDSSDLTLFHFSSSLIGLQDIF